MDRQLGSKYSINSLFVLAQRSKVNDLMKSMSIYFFPGSLFIFHTKHAVQKELNELKRSIAHSSKNNVTLEQDFKNEGKKKPESYVSYFFVSSLKENLMSQNFI